MRSLGPQSQQGLEHDWVSGQAAKCRDELIRLNEEYREKMGRDFYLYTSRPGDGQTRVVFTDAVCQGYAAGLRHMQAKLALDEARRGE
jgi:hypothetical protein